MNQVPTTVQHAACLEHLARQAQRNHVFSRLDLPTLAIQERGFTVQSGEAPAPDQAVAVRIRGKLPTSLSLFLRDMSDDRFLPSLDSSIMQSKTLVRYHIPDTQDTHFDHVLLRHIRAHKPSGLVARDLEHVAFCAMHVETDQTTGHRRRLQMRSHSITPTESIKLFLRDNDRMLHDASRFDRIHEVYSSITLESTTNSSGEDEILVDHLAVYQLPGVAPIVYEALMARAVFNKCCMLVDHYASSKQKLITSQVSSIPRNMTPISPNAAESFFSMSPQEATSSTHHLKAHLQATAASTSSTNPVNVGWWGGLFGK